MSVADPLELIGLRSRARSRDVTDLPDPVGGPSLRNGLGELSSLLEGVRLAGAVPRLSRVPRGDGSVVVDIPGWRAPELSGGPLRTYLRRLGYDARGWGLGTNTGDPVRDAGLLATRVRQLHEQHGPVSLVGWSLGGVIAREVARRHPDAVRRVVTYGTPVVGGPSHTAVARAYAEEVRERTAVLARALDADSPIQVPLTVLWSRRDGVVAWQACLDRVSPRVEHIEVRSTHLGMGVDPDVWAVVADRLSRPVSRAG